MDVELVHEKISSDLGSGFKMIREIQLIDKFLKFIEKDVAPTIKKDFTWLGKAITKDLIKLTKDKKQSKKKQDKS